MNYEIPAIIIGEPDRANFRAVHCVHKALTPFSMDNTGNLYESGLKLASDISFTSGSWHSVNSLYNYLNLYQSKPGLKSLLNYRMNLAHIKYHCPPAQGCYLWYSFIYIWVKYSPRNYLHCMDAYKEQNVIKLTRLAHGGHGHSGCFFPQVPSPFLPTLTPR